MGVREREAAVAIVEEACPRCAAARGPGQEYCLECGLRLPSVDGRLASFRRGWVRRVGWYPGDWVWISLLALVGAGAGTAVAIAVTTQTDGGGATTVVLSAPAPANAGRTRGTASRARATPAAPEPTVTVTTPGSTRSSAPAGPPNGRVVWPGGMRGWTIVLISYPSRGGRSEPLGTASRAAGLGLPEVGVLDSSDFGSLHPGYYVVFSGRYSSRADAEAALTSARASGFGGAYTRQISR